MSSTITLTTSQEEIIGYALRMAIRDQKAKLQECKIPPLSGDVTARNCAFITAGYRERITRLEAAYDLLPAE